MTDGVFMGLEDDEGNELDVYVLATFALDGKTYAAMALLEDDPDADGNATIMRVENPETEDERYVELEDDAEFKAALAEWERIKADHPLRKCRVCGCDDLHACEGGCYWVEPDLCSRCAAKLKAGEQG